MSDSKEIAYLGPGILSRLMRMLLAFERGAFGSAFRRHRTPIMSDGGCDPQNAKVDVSLLGKPTVGTFILAVTINAVTEPLTFNVDDDATAAKATMATHSEIESTDLTVTGGPWPNATMRFEFIDTLARKDIAIPTADWDDLLGGLGTAVVCALAQKGHG